MRERSEALRDPPAAGRGGAAAWRRWMSQFGSHVRRVREFLGLSQVELARRAGVSQGAISRFEAGRGLNTPLLVALKINMVLARELVGTDPATRTDDVQHFLRLMEFLALPDESGLPLAPGGVPFAAVRLMPDRDLEEMIAVYRKLPPDARRALAAAVQALGARRGERARP